MYEKKKCFVDQVVIAWCVVKCHLCGLIEIAFFKTYNFFLYQVGAMCRIYFDALKWKCYQVLNYTLKKNFNLCFKLILCIEIQVYCDAILSIQVFLD